MIAYPDDVFFGKVMKRAILPHIEPFPQITPMVESALTLATLELASVGIGVAWVPMSIARDRVADGRLVDLSEHLPTCSLIVTAVRLVGNRRAAEAAVWAQLSQLSDVGDSDGSTEIAAGG